MNIAISGASGFVGRALVNRLRETGHTVTIIGREAFSMPDDRFRESFIEDRDAVINLAGAPVIKRWTPEYKKVIYDSRILTTARIARSIVSARVKPTLFISMSAIGIYDSVNTHTESSTLYNRGFLASVCTDWEKEAMAASEVARTVVLRTGVVLGADGGALGRMKFPFSIGLGGKIGSGEQHFSFIHLFDLTEMVLFLLENRSVSGIVNAVSPFPTTNADFSDKLGKALRQPVWMTVPPFVLKKMYGEGAVVLLEGQKVLPEKIQQAGFTFRYPTIQNALVRIYA